MTDFPLILLITFALFIQIEASSFEAKMSEEVNMCNENMSEVWLQSTELLAKYKELKKQSLKKTLYLKDTN